MTTEVIQNCCTLIRQHQECDFSDPNFNRDVFTPGYYEAPAVTFCIMASIFLILILIVLKNLVQVFRSRSRFNIASSMIMNLLILLDLSIRFTYLLDGPLQLMNYTNGYSVSAVTVFQLIAICFLNLTLVYSSYTWEKLILMFTQDWERGWVATGIKAVFSILAFCFIGIASFTFVLSLIHNGNEELYYQITTIPLSAISVLNGIIFMISSYRMGHYLTKIYDFNNQKKNLKARRLKMMAIGIAFFALVRMLNDSSAYVFHYWPQKLNVKSYCEKNLYWSLYLFMICFIADICPILFFLIVFAPKTRPKSLDNSIRSADERMFSVSDTDKSVIEVTEPLRS